MLLTMKANALLQALDEWDTHGLWAFDIPRLQMIFDEPLDSFKKALVRHVRAGIITRVARGVYVNPRARHMPVEPLLALVSIMRPFDFSYLSLETVLSEAGWISQVTQRYTLMSTGRSSVFYTPYGVMEFTHTSRTAEVSEVTFDPERGIHVATPKRAYQDLRTVKRNVDMVEVPEEEGV